MFADSVIESSATTGTGTYTLAGAAFSGLTFAQGFSAGIVAYFAQTLDKAKWEFGYGTLTIGPPRTLTRTVVKSSNANAAVNWQSTDTYYVFSIASADALNGLLGGNLASGTRPWWVRQGGRWWDYAAGLAVSWVDYLYSGSANIRTGVFDAVKALYFPDSRSASTAVGAANKTFDATHVGGSFTFSTSAAQRVATLLAGATAKDGYWVEMKGLSSSNGIVLTPDAGDGIDGGADGVTKTIPGGILFRVRWDAAADMWLTSYVAPTAPTIPPPYRNRLINGDFAIDQRNEGVAQTFTAAAAVAYTVDRWYASCTGANITGARVAGTSPNQFAYRFTGAASNTAVLFGQRIVAADIADLVSADVAVSLKAKSSSITTLNWKAYKADAADNFSAKTQIASGSLTITSSLADYSFTFNAGASAANGIAIEFDCGALLAAATLQFENVQLESGTTANAFERKSYADRLRACQRFYWKTFADGTAPAQNAGTTAALHCAMMASSTASQPIMGGPAFPVRMRAAPTVTLYNPSAANAFIRNITGGADFSASSGVATANGFGLTGQPNSGAFTSDFCNVHAVASAEV